LNLARLSGLAFDRLPGTPRLPVFLMADMTLFLIP
jgi:hypothetical protein